VRHENRRVECTFLQIRNVRQSAAESRSAHVSKRHTQIAFDRASIKTDNLRGAVVKSPSRGPNFANTQCEAIHRRIPLSSGLQAPYAYHSARRACQMWESSRRRRDIAESRAQFREYAMRGSPPPHPTRLRSPRTSRTSLSMASVSKGGIFEGS